MLQTMTIRGLREGLERDAWWFGTATPGGTALPSDGQAGINVRNPKPFLALLALVALADGLFWGRTVGISLAVYALAIFGMAAAGRPWRVLRRPLALVLLGALPVIEHVQTLSVALLAASLLVALVCLSMTTARRVEDVLARAAMLAGSLRHQGLHDLNQAVHNRKRSSPFAQQRLRALLQGWLLPIGGTLILLALLMDANPVIEQWIVQVLNLDINWLDAARRVLFWVGVGLIVWPLITVRADDLDPTTEELPSVPFIPLGFNAGSVLRALVPFNLMLGLQTAMDGALLWGGGTLPQGMGYAEYAHRGAYPLLITALLAGGFALAARPFLGEHRLLRPLLLLWLAQNMALCVSSALRLELYVQVFGLTYLRLYVMIWIAVVGIGLGMIAWQIWRNKPNRWLLLRSAGLGVGVLYLTSFVSFAPVIAEQNLRMEAHRIDWQYLCDLPDIVDPVILTSNVAVSGQARPPQHCVKGPAPIEGWRDWGFRRWRALRNMDEALQAEIGDEDTGGR